MMPIKVQIVIHLIRFAPKSIIWAGTKACVHLILKAGLLIIHDPHISPHGVGVKCPDDDINKQHILRAPAITLSGHRAVYDAKCGRPQRGRGLVKCGQGRGG